MTWLSFALGFLAALALAIVAAFVAYLKFLLDVSRVWRGKGG